MSADISDFDPYRSPTLPERPYLPKPGSGKPGMLTAVCVIAIVLGALGLCNGLLGVMGVIAGQQLQSALQPKAGPGMPPEMQQAMDNLQAEMNAVQGKYYWFLLASVLLRLIAALLLLIGGLKALSLKETGRRILIIAFAVAIGFELVNAMLQSFVQLDSLTAVNSYMEAVVRTMPQGGNAPPGMQNFMQMIGGGILIATLVMIYGLALIKLGLYLFSIVYLQRVHIRALFTDEAPPATPLA